VGKRKIETVRVSPEVEQAYRQLLEKMFQLGEQVGAQNVERLILPKHAERRFIDWREQVELWLGEGETLGSMQDWGGKLCGLTARLATVIHLAESLPQMLPSFTLAYRAWMLLSKSRNGRSRMQKRRLGCLVMMAGQ
jgi:hypothetical protein